MHVKKGDKVIVITGKDKGKSGTVVRAFPRRDSIIVEGVNVKKHHQRPRGAGQKGQVLDKTMPIHVSNVRLAEARSSKK